MIRTTLLLCLLCTPVTFKAQQETPPLWLTSPAISPDGKTIAFSYQGDIYTVPYQGGEATRITLHEAYESDPVWSPDSKMLAFSSTRHGNKDVFVTDAKGGTPTRLTYHSSGDVPYSFTTDGRYVMYGSARLDHHRCVLFPTGALPELYMVPVSGGRERQVLTSPAEMVNLSADGTRYLYHDQKGYEDPFRKHHTSSVARDVWMYSAKDSSFSQITDHPAEDRNPVWAAGEDRFFFLSERSGSFNVWKAQIINGKEANARQVTTFDTHPVRSLSISGEGVLCYHYHGEIYTQLDGQPHVKVPVSIRTDRRYNETVAKVLSDGATDYAVSPNGKEVAFIIRGEVFVTAMDHSITKRITNTSVQERDLHFNSDGSRLMYSSERNGSWNIYESSLSRKDEKYFYNATLIEEKALVETPEETFQARYAPDDSEIAFIEERTTLRVKNLKSGEVRTILPGHLNYSYSDGDQYYTWSPDGKWLLATYLGYNRWNGQVGLVDASGKKPPINLTESGYGNYAPKFAMEGQMVYWETDRDGFRSHGSWGSQIDVYAIFLNDEAHRRFKMTKAEYELWKETEEENKKKEDEAKEKDKKGGKKEQDDKKPPKPIEVQLEGLDMRRMRLTEFSSFLSDVILDEKVENMYYITQTDKGFSLWKTNFRESETKLLAKLGDQGSSLYFDKEGKHLIVNTGGALQKIAVADGKQEPIAFKAEMNLNTDAERTYMFDHAWRQFKKKFYVEDLHGVDWEMYRTAYAKFLPHINNGFDFADMLSEMLGEVNASHTGAFYWGSDPAADHTASLGAYYDERYTGNGLRIAELMPRSPLMAGDAKVKAGVIIEKIDGVEILPESNFYPMLNRKAGHRTLISYFDPVGKSRWEHTVIPVPRGAENEMAYERWVRSREAETERLSGGKVGYVHVRGMNSQSFRETYSRALGKHNDKEALVVDTRFNGGGWLHDDLATFLSGELYMKFEPRGQDNLGGEPLAKWQKPSAVIMCEGNYSDAHMFPYTYKHFEIGKLVGMPVPGTGTAVWWERMLDGTVFGIPQVGMRDVRSGQLLENLQLEPDIKVMNEPGVVSKGRDQQLEEAVKHLQSQVKQ